MSSSLNFFDDMIEERLAQLHTLAPCRVESYNESAGTANVVPLFMRKFRDRAAEAMPPLTAVPVLKRKYRNTPGGSIQTDIPVYERGDIVLVGFAERALDHVLSGRIADPQFERKHALEDGIILGYLGW